MTFRRPAIFLFLAVSAFSQAPEFTYKIVHTYPHDPGAFTQGLEYRNGALYEGTGLPGFSSLRRVDLATGRVLQQTPLSAKYFGEGITLLNGVITQLTWKSEEGFQYDPLTLKPIRNFKYSGEGWGLANDGKQIYMSDGTSQIRVWDGASLLEIRRITVKDGAKSISLLNELEWVKGEIFANVWQTDRIARISPTDGKVLGWIDLAGILPASDRTRETDVLNGIAWDATGNRLFVTGKKWPKLFEIELVPKKK